MEYPRQSDRRSPLRWIFFDAFGTLLDYAGIFERVAGLVHRREEMDVPVDAFHDRWRALTRRQMDHRWHCEPYRTVREWFAQSLADTFGHFGHAGDVDKDTELNLREVRTAAPFPDARPCLEALHVDHRIAVVSNIDRSEIVRILRKHPLPHDLLVTSEDARAYKPDPALLHSALERADARPDEVLHVGDSACADVEGARRAGITPVWLNRTHKTLPEDIAPPTHEIETLADLAALVGHISIARSSSPG